MGDRTSVFLEFNKEHIEFVKKLYDLDENDITHTTSNISTAGAYFTDVNYGELWDLHELEDQGIAYSSNWDRGDNYDPGAEHLRFGSNGLSHKKTIYESDHLMAVSYLLSLIDDPVMLVEQIKKVAGELELISFDDQVKNGKLYLARRLITQA